MPRSSWAPPLLAFALVPALLLAQTPLAKEAAKRDFSKEAVVVERVSDKIKFETDRTSVEENSVRVRIQSEAGLQRYGLLTFPYEDATGTFQIDYVRVSKADGAVVATPPDSIQDMPAQITRQAPFYSDIREKHVTVKGLGIGDVLEFATTQRVTKPLVPGQFWHEYNFSHDGILLEASLEVQVPRDRAVKVKSAELKPARRTEGSHVVYTWISSNLDPAAEGKDKEKELKEAWEQVRGRHQQPEVMVSSFETWDEVGRWYGSLQAERIKPVPGIQAKAAELTSGLADEEAKIRAIYSYVSAQFRYIGVAFGIGRYQPHTAGDVLENKYGDCKDKHTLLAALLNAVGIQAYPALISSVREIDPDVPSPGQFDHVITAVQSSHGLLWLDTTAEVGPFGFLIPPLRDKHALLIPDSRPAELVNTPADPPFRSMQTFRMDASLSEAGLLEGKAEFLVRGDLEYLLRSAFRNVAMPQWNELAQGLSRGFGFGGEVSEANTGPPEKTGEPLRVTYKYTRKEFGDWANHRILAAVPAIGLPGRGEDEPAPSVPLWLGAPGDLEFQSRISLPKSYAPQLPAAVHVKVGAAEYDSTYAFENGVFIANRHLRILNREVATQSYEEYKKLRKAVEDDYGLYIQLSSVARPAGGSALPPPAVTSVRNVVLALPASTDAEALRLEGEARDAAARKDTQGAITSLYRAVSADPKFSRAWVMLGGLLLMSGQHEAGTDAFHKALAVDTEHPVINKLFGYSLMASTKFEEAVPVFQAYIKGAPEDVDGPANLAAAFLALQRYPEAATALEAALKLKPEDTELQRELGSSYLRSGADEKAAGIFHQLLDKDSSAENLNDVAYEMADLEKQPKVAVEYAEKAVQTQEATSDKISLEGLDLDDLRNTTKLAAYWDTLGWAHTRMGKFADAEGYLKAAWTLSQDGIVAGHLCALYEQMHRTPAAIHMCQLSMYRLPLASGEYAAQASGELGKVRSRLEHLSPGGASSKDMGAITEELNRMLTFKLPRLIPGTVSCEIFVLLASTSKAGGFTVRDAKFVSGSEKLKPHLNAVKAINFNMPAPDTNRARFVRRGILGCYQYTGCSLVLLDPNQVNKLD